MIWVFTVSLPVILLNSPVKADVSLEDFELTDLVGLSLFGLGLAIETIADIEKFNFRTDIDNKGHWCDKGK